MLQAWFFIAAALLVVSGGSKLVDPAPTVGAMAAARLPSNRGLVYILAATEIAAGALGLTLGGPAALLVAVIYAAFAGFVALALARNLPIASCGCFGKEDTPPTALHIVFNVLSAAAAVGVAVSNQAPIDLLSGQPGWGLPYLGFVALGVWAVYLLLAVLPQTVGRR